MAGNTDWQTTHRVVRRPLRQGGGRLLVALGGPGLLVLLVLATALGAQPAALGVPPAAPSPTPLRDAPTPQPTVGRAATRTALPPPAPPAPPIPTPPAPPIPIPPAPPILARARPAAEDTPTPAPAPVSLMPFGVPYPTFADAQHGWVVLPLCDEAGACTTWLRTTADGGTSWQTRPLPAGDVAGIRFATARDGWVISPGHFFTTHDGGLTWADTAGPGPTGLPEPGPGAAWAFGQTCTPTCRPGLFRSPDNGHTWQATRYPPIQGTVQQMIPQGARDAWVLSAAEVPGHDSSALHLLATHDAGQTWRALPTPCGATEEAQLGAAAPGQLWLLCGDLPLPQQQKRLYRSADGGHAWQLVGAADGLRRQDLPAGVLGDLAVAAPDQAWLALQQPAALYRTTDGGRTWHPAITLGDDAPVGQVQFVDAQHGWWGAMGHLYRTSDGGDHWVDLGLP
ncbi:MAG TPA: hypothetical protein VKY74_13450 [Chloroflexia bacterium]|nr:hypothetical protein [Chloroflexia bacterium]